MPKNVEEMLSLAQESAWSALVDNIEKNPVTCQVLPAGAGAGKTHLISVFVSSLIQKGYAADSIEAISFTKLSAEELQKRVLKQQYEISENIQNMNFSTIHSHAFNFARKLAPHIHGVDFYLQNSSKKSFLLSVMASVKYGLDKDFLEKHIPNQFIENDLFDNQLDIDNFFNNTKRTVIQRFISSDETDFTYPISLVTELLLNIKNKINNHEISEDFLTKIGVPKVLIVDEAQDVDVVQLLYLRALNSCGTHILMVGDKNQTIYRWRQALGELIFTDNFMENIFSDSYVKILNDTPLNENWRSRKEILNFADEVSTETKKQNEKNYKNFKPSYDTSPLKMIPTQDIDKEQSSVSVFMKDNFDDKNNQFLKNQNGRLMKNIQKRDSARIFQWLKDVSVKIREGDSAVIIMHHNADIDDINSLKEILDEDINVVKVSSEKCVALSKSLSIVKENDTLKLETGIPLSNMMVAMAIHFILDDSIFEKKLPKLILSHPNPGVVYKNLINLGFPEEIESYLDKVFNMYEKSIRSKTFLSKDTINYCTEFVLRTISKYASISWIEHFNKTYEETDILYVPYRFTHMASKRERNENGETYNIIRPADEQRLLFKYMWSAISTVKFPVPKNYQDSICINDIIEPNLNLSNIASVSCNLFAGENTASANHLMKTRENSYEALMNSFHKPIRDWMSITFKNIEKDVLEYGIENSTKNAYIRFLKNWDVRAKFKLCSYMSSDKPEGLIKTLSVNNEEFSMKKRNVSRIDGTLELSTIHASKGMEWDHVLYVTFDGFSENFLDETSKKSITHHDYNYVTMTRARKTLAITINNSNKTLKDNSLPEEVVNDIFYSVGKKMNIINAKLDFGPNLKREKRENNGLIIKDETSHSEMKVALQCGQQYDFEYRRNMKSMSFIPFPIYSVFFHTTMSEIVAHLSSQRINITEDDPIFHLSKTIKKIIGQNLDETEIFNSFEKDNNYIDKMVEDLIPSYLYGPETDYYHILKKYYNNGIKKHLASILYGTDLFENVINPNAIVQIEKTMRNIMYKENYVLPYSGIPDLCIFIKDKAFIYDYKTIPEQNRFSVGISENIAMQLNIYMSLALKKENIKNVNAEAIYLQDITVHNNIPNQFPKKNIITGRFGFVNEDISENANFLRAQKINENLYSKIATVMKNTKDLAEQQERDIVSPSLRMDSSPLLSEEQNAKNSAAKCLSCSQNHSCSKSKVVESYNKIYVQKNDEITMTP